MVSATLAPRRLYDCQVLDSPSVCVITVDHGDWLAQDSFTVRVVGLASSSRRVLKFTRAFDASWSRTVGVDDASQASVTVTHLDLVVTLIGDGVVLGATTINRRLSRKSFTLLVDPKNKRVTARPGGGRPTGQDQPHL